MKKRILPLIVAVIMLISSLPMTTFAAEPGTTPKAWVEGYTDGSTSNFRSAQMLVVKTSGFSDNAKLNYHYYSTNSDRAFYIYYGGFNAFIPNIKMKSKPASTSGPFGFLGAFCNVIDAIGDLITIEDAEGEFPYFAVMSSPAVDMKVRIVVTDTNKKSETYNKSVELKVGPFQKANLVKDLNVPWAMFEGDTKYVPELLMLSGLTQAYPNADEYTLINSLKIENVDEGTVTVLDGPSGNNKYYNTKVTANQSGLAKMKISVTKAESAGFHQGLTGVGDNYIRVFKKPEATPVDDGFDLTNTEKGVTYTIGSMSKSCSADGETLSFRGLAGDCEYEVICSEQLANGMKAKASFTAKTLVPFYIEFITAEHPGVTGLPERQEASKSGLEKAEKPENPYAPGYVFGDWYTEPTYEHHYNFDSLVTSNLALRGKWLPLKHTTVVKLTLNGEAYSGRTVELYQDYQKKYTLEETETAGTYRLENAVETGAYDIYVDGCSVYAPIKVTGTRCEKDLSASQLSTLISGETITTYVRMVPLKTQCRLDGEEANVGEVFYKDEMGNHITAQYVGDAEGKYYYAPTSVTDPRVQDIFVNGADSDRLGINDAAKDISVASPSKVLDFYKMSFVVNIGDAEWTSSNVVLRDKDGNFVAQLTPESYNSIDGTRAFSAVLSKDEKATPDEYTVYLDGADTGIVLTATESGHSKTASAYKATVNVQKDGAAWNDAVVMISNEDYSYTLYEGGTSGKYETALLYDANNEKPYSVMVNATVDQLTNSLNTESKQIDMNFNSVKYYSYKKGSKDGTYELENSKPYREQTVRTGSKALQVAEPYVEGLTFRCFATEQWTLGETPVTAYDCETPVSSQLTLYAHFENPEININGFVKSDESGAVSSTGEYFILPNLTISGFDEGGAIKSILITVSNVENVTFPSKDGVTVNSKDGTHAITFAEKVSMAEAQVYLRTAVFKPVQEKEINMSITVSDGVIDASSETSFTQSQITETWTKLSSVSGYNTRTSKGLALSSGNYFVDQSVTITNASAGGGGLRISGTVKLYIPQGVTVTCTGGNGSGQTGGGAGVYLPSGSNLYLYGAGTLNANGGNAGDGEKGENGKDSIFRVSLESYVTESGRGGNSGGGAGAGIGTNGASGVDGAAPTGSYSSTYKGQTGIYIPDETDIPGMKGNSGNNGNTAADAGNVYTNGVTVNPVGGGAGNSVSGKSSSGGYDTHKWNRFWTAGSSGGGGNGKSGRAGNNVGPGGSSGGSGGSGGSGAIIWTSGSATWNAIGGRGGNGDESGEKGTKSNESVGGDGGNGGSTPANKIAKSVQSCAALTGYTVTFAGAQGSPATTSYALNSKNIVVNVPDYTPESGLFFLGWRVSTYGKNIDGQSDIKPLTTAETKLYQPGESITLAELTYGNIELKPVTIAIAGKTDTDKLSVPDTEFASSAQAKNYFVYTVNTKLNGTAADIGTLVLKPETGDSITLGGNGFGTYSLTTEKSTSYQIYVNNEDSGVTVIAGTPAEIQANQITVTTKLNGSASAVPGDVTLVSENATLSSVPVLSGGEFTGTYRIQKLVKDMPSETEYTVYVDGENTDVKVKAGDNASVDFYAAEVTVQGNITVDAVVLKNTAAGDVILSKSDSVYSGIALQDDTTVYDVYVNGQPTGKNVKFNATNRTVSVTGNVLTITVRVNGVASDDTGLVPTYKGVEPKKVGVGTYQITAFGDVAKAVIDGTQKAFTNGNCVFDFYTVTYDGNGETSGVAPIDNNYYIEGSKPTVSSLNSLSKEDYLQNGWSISGDGTGTVYLVGDTLPEISGKLTLQAVWKQLSEYPIIIVKGDEVIYGGPENLRKVIEERNYPEEGNGTPELTIIIRDNTELPENVYLGPKDELVVESPAVVEAEKLTNEGNITVEQGAELQISEKLDNHGEVENNGKIVVEENAQFLNEEDGTVENVGTFEVKDDAEFINKGEFKNTEEGTLQIDKDGNFTNTEDGNVINDGTTVVNGSMENNGTMENNGSLKTTTNPGGSIDNNNVINSPYGATIELPIENEDGLVVGGNLKEKGSINGGVVIGLDSSEASPDALKDTKDSIKGQSSTPAPGGKLPENPTQNAIDAVFGAGNALLLTDDQGDPIIDENGNYVIGLKNGVNLEKPIEISEGVAVTLELAGNKIEGSAGQTAIIITDGTLDIYDTIGGGGISGGVGTLENGGTGDGGNGIKVCNDGKLHVNENVEVSGGPGVGSGKGGVAILIDLDPEGDGEVYIDGKTNGGNGGSDVEETPGDGGTALEIINAPKNKVVLGPENEMDGGEGGSNSEGEKGEQGTDTELAPEAQKSVRREPFKNADNVEIILVNKLYVTGETQEQKIQVKVDGELVAESDYSVSKNTASAAGEYALKVTFNDEISDTKTYASLAGKYYQKVFEIYKNPVEAPELTDACTIDYINETITPKSGYEMSLSRGTTFENALLNGTTDIDFGKTYYLRKVESDYYAPSSENAYTPLRPTVPAAPEEMKRTDDTITVKVVLGQEYSIDSGETWQSSGAFTGLNENTEYHIITRIKATESSFKSNNSNAVTLKSRNSASPAPDDASISDVTVTGTSATLPTNGDPNKYEYSLDGINWTDSNVFTNLDPATEYTFYVREKETDTAMPSEVGTVKRYTAERTPKAGEGYSLNADQNIITVKPGYEISTSNDPFEPITLTNQKLSIVPGKTYYIRKVGTGDVPSSEAKSFKIPVRKDTPDEPDDDDQGGNASGQERKIDADPVLQQQDVTVSRTTNTRRSVVANAEEDDSLQTSEDITEETDKTDLASYQIIEGANGKWIIGKTGDLSFISDAPFEKFSYVKVDGDVIDDSNYSVVKGSTKVTLKDTYLKTLSKGKHTLEIVSTDGSVETEFFIVDDIDSQDTGNIDNSDDNDVNNTDAENGGHLYWWLLIVLFVICVSVVILFIVKKRKDEQNNRN